MQRDNGFIDILKLLNIELETKLDGTDEADYYASLELYDKLCSNKAVRIIKHELGLRLLFSFEYEGITYFFKYESLTKPLHELFAYEVATRLGLNAVQYDLAVLGPYKGVISKDFKKEGAQYIEGLDVLIRAYPEYLKDYSKEEDECYKRQCILRDYGELNSLESIWNAFEIRYKDRVDKDSIVENLMSKIVNIFVLDVLLGEVDRTAANWYLVEYVDGKVDIGSVFDNSRIFFRTPEFSQVSMPVSSENRFLSPSHLSFEENIREFIKKSDESFNTKLINGLNILDSTTVSEMLSAIEKRIEIPLSDETKNLYITLCQIQRNFLDEILEQRPKFTK